MFGQTLEKTTLHVLEALRGLVFFNLVLSDPEMDLPRITVQAVKAPPS